MARLRLSERSLAFRDRHPTSRKIFVLGTGRSGTHFLAQTLGAHPEVHPSIEDQYVFRRITRMAVDSTTLPMLLPGVVRRIKLRHVICAPRHYLDKSHPALWIAEELADAFPRARFIGIERDVFGTVASMLKHRGILRWQRTWREYPVPNQFLGITEDIAAIYDELDTPARCAVRWQAHIERARQLEVSLGDRFLVVRYDRLVKETDSVLSTLREALGLSTPIPPPLVNTDSLYQWRRELDDASLHSIAKWTGQTPPSDS